MDQLPDYSSFVKNAYVVALAILIIAGAWWLVKFLLHNNSLKKMQKDEKKD